MTASRLTASEAAELSTAPLTYDRAVVDDPEPHGFQQVERTVVLRRRDLDGAGDDLLGWRMHERSGLRVAASDTPLTTGSVVVLRLGLGPASLRIPCRVVEVVDEPGRRGFSYGTLPGHPESGEERFLLERQEDGAIRFTISAVWRPASLLARLGGPVSVAVQRRMTSRYLRALDAGPRHD